MKTIPERVKRRFTDNRAAHGALLYEVDPDGCWIWRRAVGTNGYGTLRWRDESQRGVMMQAHRASYQAFIGPIPEGLTIDHLCRRRLCVNPAHLEPVTLQENLRRGRQARALPPILARG